MRVAKLQIRIAILALLALSASACQTAQKPASLLPAKTAPALTATAPAPAPAPQQTAARCTKQPLRSSRRSRLKPHPKRNAANSSPDASAPDPVADLIAKVEKDFQAGLDAYNAGQTDAAKQDFDKRL